MKDQHTMEFDRCTPSHFRLEPNRLRLHDNLSKIHFEHQEPPSTTNYLDACFKVFLLIIMFLVCTLTTHPEKQNHHHHHQQKTNTTNIIPLQHIPQTDNGVAFIKFIEVKIKIKYDSTSNLPSLARSSVLTPCDITHNITCRIHGSCGTT